MSSDTDYQHPGKLFVARYGLISEDTDILKYAGFLRQEAGLSDAPPIDLNLIFARFGIKSPERIPLPGQAGLLLNPDHGTIFINEDDPAKRQRFSEAHELIELLFAAQTPSASWSARSLFSDTKKEKLCEVGAAELLMPLSTFKTFVDEWGVSLETGKRLAELYDVSLSAALLRCVQFGPGQHALVLWKLAHKPSEIQSMPSSNQMHLFEEDTFQKFPKKLRVQWGCSTNNEFFIPPHKSIEQDTSIYKAYEHDTTISGKDWVDLVSVRGYCFCESMAVTICQESFVLSVIHLPHDEHS